MKITDAHAHIFPAAIAAKAAESIGKFYGGMEMYGDGTREALLKSGEKAGVLRYFVHSVATTPGQVRKINDFIAESAAQSDGRLIGFATMHPDFPDMEGELDRALSLGLKGVKLHPDMQRFAIDDKRVMRLYEAMCLRHMPLVAHTGDARYDYSNPERTARVLKAFPDLKMQCAHFGGYSHWEDVMEKLEGLGAYTDTSSSLFALSAEKATELLRFFGADHVMFGSDFPMWDASEELRRLDALPLTQDEKRLVLWDSADRFLNTDIR